MQTSLTQVIDRYTPDEGTYKTPLDGLNLYSAQQPMPRTPLCYVPTICVVAQAGKRIYVGERYYDYDPHNYLINAVAMPVEAEIRDASTEYPYLGLSLELDRYIISELILEMDAYDHQPAEPRPELINAVSLTVDLASAFRRLIECSQQPMDCAVMATVIKREIFYQVLKGPQGGMLRNCMANHSGANRVAPVIHFIEQNFQQPLGIDELANVAGMSASTLHEHFKQATTLSPMQYVKSLRLHQARTLLLSGCQAAEACWQVGYTSPSQFSREFKRFFGELPRDVQQLVQGG